MSGYTTITDAYSAFEDLHGGEHPVRSRDELQAAIHACDLRYEAIDRRFWDAAFDSGWAYDDTVDIDAIVVAYGDR